MHDRTDDGRALRILNIIDQYTRECLAIDVGRSVTSENVLGRLANLFATRGVPEHIRSDNGPEFVAEKVRSWLGRLGVKTAFIEKGSPWENAYIESFNGKLRDELLNREIFDTVQEAQVLLGRWRYEYNHLRPHSSLGYRSPAEARAARTQCNDERQARLEQMTDFTTGLQQRGRSPAVQGALTVEA